MRILCLNCGSSTLKFALRSVTDTAAPSETEANGIVDRVGKASTLSFATAGVDIDKREVSAPDHKAALEIVLALLQEHGLLEGIDAIGHRVVHGGSRYLTPALIDQVALDSLTELIELAPLHNAPATAAIEASWQLIGHRLPMVAVFDTSFYRDLPPRAAEYAIPRSLAKQYGIRRYGFHGLAHRSMLESYTRLSGKPLGRTVSLQLGNGCSATASLAGRALDTSMGFTPLEGLIMGTRSGDIDPAVGLHLVHHAGMTANDVNSLLNHESGLLGLSGVASDMRAVLAAEAAGDPNAVLAVEAFCYRVVKYVGAYAAVLGGLDALLFGGGIGEGSAEIRRRVCSALAWLGLWLDEPSNQASDPGARSINSGASPIDVWRMAVDEEDVISRDVYELLTASGA